MNDRVSLRPVQEADLATIVQLTQDAEMAGEYAWCGWSDPRVFPRRWEDDRLLGKDGGVLMAVVGDQTVGALNWGRRPITPFSSCWRLGRTMLPEARGRGYGTQAARLIAAYLFAHTQLNRIEATTEIGNLAAQKSLTNAGYTREGTLRGFIWRDGAWHDSAQFSILRTDPPTPQRVRVESSS
ncbi:GNAT family N-acetyltransferase [Actinomadura oligospora]|uniref:GNAT family N-acetyltransferase n=1 Tax=Actinomadura oligospora TaxID=111804 RepID=UPI00047EF7D4|nr:GNAT family protein [Actinomadura oligospora]